MATLSAPSVLLAFWYSLRTDVFYRVVASAQRLGSTSEIVVLPLCPLVVQLDVLFSYFEKILSIPLALLFTFSSLVREALARIDMLVAQPAKVLCTNVAVVRLGRFHVHSIGRVALRTPHTLALS